MTSVPPSQSSRNTLIAIVVVGLLVLASIAAFVIGRIRYDAAGAALVDVRVIAANDFHGNLEPPVGSSGKVTTADGSSVDAGGAAYVATHLATLRKDAPGPVVVLSTGDNIGASPVPSALFHDEPTIEMLNALGVQAATVGNHEFDKGFAELQRIQKGGCHPGDGCMFHQQYPGADFPYLGANVTDAAGGPVLPASTVLNAGGVKVGVIGVVLHDLPSVVSVDAIRGLKIGDEIEAANKASAALSAQGVNTQVLLVHQGDEGNGGGPNDCKVDPDGPAAAIAKGVSPAIDVVFSAHTHQQYVCTVTDPAGAPRPLIQGLSYGRLLSVVDLPVNPADDEVDRARIRAFNEVVTRDVPPDPVVGQIVAEAVAKSRPIANRKVGSITADLTRNAGPSGESSLGDVLSDAQLAATKAQGAQVALLNPGGIRADLPYAPDGVVTYGEAYAVQPFGNIMQTMTMTGADLKAVLEQQWHGQDRPRILSPSSSLHYTFSAAAPEGSKVSNMTIDGVPVDPAKTYRVAANNFLAAGGDKFSGFTKGTNVTGGAIDLDAFLAYLAAHPGIAPPPADRITAKP